MPTQSESRALAFFAALFALGGALRVVATLRDGDRAATAADSLDLARHLDAVDVARGSAPVKRRGRRAEGRDGAGPARDAAPTLPPPPAGVPPELAAAAGWFARPRDDRPGAAPARRLPRRDTIRSVARSPTASSGPPGPGEGDTAPVDVDVADAATLEALPGIGPALARRLVEDRGRHGPFGSLDGLARVKGVGPVLRARLATRVTFSGAGRPP